LVIPVDSTIRRNMVQIILSSDMGKNLFLSLLLLVAGPFGFAQGRQAPAYSVDTILSAASGQPAVFAPNSLIAIHGTGLANASVELDLSAVSEIPTVLIGSGARVYIRNQLAGIISATPTQLLVLIPPNLIAGMGNLQVLVDGRAGPALPIRVRAAAPAMFLRAEGLVAVTREDGSDVTPEKPGVPGELVTFYATGLGPTRPAADGLTILKRQAPLTMALQVLLDGVALDASAVEYAGIVPGSVGTYQVRCRLPSAATSELPEVRLLVDGQMSQEGVRVPVVF
jgi:uncharacterized protein (TIGR03437 family)